MAEVLIQYQALPGLPAGRVIDARPDGATWAKGQRFDLFALGYTDQAVADIRAMANPMVDVTLISPALVAQAVASDDVVLLPVTVYEGGE